MSAGFRIGWESLGRPSPTGGRPEPGDPVEISLRGSSPDDSADRRTGVPIPSRAELLKWAHDYVALWNAGDEQGWVDNWKQYGTGEFRMLDPVGTPEKVGFEHCCLDSWKLFQSRVRFKHHNAAEDANACAQVAIAAAVKLGVPEIADIPARLKARKAA